MYLNYWYLKKTNMQVNNTKKKKVMDEVSSSGFSL